MNRHRVVKHKLYCAADDSTESVELAARTWSMGGSGLVTYDSTGLVGKRIFVYWEGVYTDETAQQKSVNLWGSGLVPYECFVVKFLGPNHIPCVIYLWRQH